VDWGTVGILAGVVTLEGFRRLPAGALVLRRPLLGPWSVAQVTIERGRWALVAWWPPFFTTVVLPPVRPAAPGATSADVAAFLRESRPWRIGLEALGALVLVALVAGLPLAVARFGPMGFLGGLGLVLALAATTSGLAAWARGALGLPRRPALTALSPFAAPQAAERLLEEALAPVPRVLVLRALLPAAPFTAWLRPRLFDAARAAGPDRDLADLVTPELRAAFLAPPDRLPGADRYCPRCGASYRDGERCGDCEGVALVRFTP
jgi:hypothetical protein